MDCLRRPSTAILGALLLALPFPRPALAQDAERLVDQARSAAREDRNRESADLFARAIASDPARREALLAEYADQLTYSDRAREAVPLYRERLARTSDPGERRRLLKGLGLALLWSDRPGEAADVYTELLRLDPEDADARRNHARALAWSARPRAAIAALDDWLDRHPDDVDAQRQRAEAYGWIGRPDRARESLARAGTDRPETVALGRRLDEAVAPVTGAEFARSSQSDRLDIDQVSLWHEQPLREGRGMLGARVERLRFASGDGLRRVDLDRPMLIARYRFSDAWELNTRLGQDRVDLDTGRDYDRFVYATWLTWWPSDLLRLDLSAGRGTLDSLRAFDLGISARTLGASVDVTPDERHRGSLRLERAEFSDGNVRDRGQVLAERRLGPPRLAAWAGLRWTAFEFEQQLDNGYFNPRRLHSPQATFRLAPSERAGQRWSVAMESAWGREFVEPGRTQPAWEFGATGAWRFTDDWRLQAGWRRFSTRTSDLSGFERTIASLQLQGRW